MSLNVSKLKDLQKGLNDKASGGGDDLFLYSNKLGEETYVRALPPLPKMNGIYYAEQEGWWINGKFYQSNSSFGKDDVIKMEIDEAKAAKDKDLDALINAKKDQKPLLKKETRYMMPILLLNVEFDKDDQISALEVVDGKAKILVAKPTLITEINRIVTHRTYQNKTADGLMDRVKGYNLILSKTGSGKNTSYSAMGDKEPIEMPEEFYTEEAIPDVMAMTEKMAHSDDYLRGVIRNYLYGEEMPSDEKKSDEKPAAESGKKIIVGAKKAEKTAEVEKPAVKAAVKKGAVVVGKGAPRNVLADAENTNDEQFDDLDD